MRCITRYSLHDPKVKGIIWEETDLANGSHCMACGEVNQSEEKVMGYKCTSCIKAKIPTQRRICIVEGCGSTISKPHCYRYNKCSTCTRNIRPAAKAVNKRAIHGDAPMLAHKYVDIKTGEIPKPSDTPVYVQNTKKNVPGKYGFCTKCGVVRLTAAFVEVATCKKCTGSALACKVCNKTKLRPECYDSMTCLACAASPTSQDDDKNPDSILEGTKALSICDDVNGDGNGDEYWNEEEDLDT